MKTKIKVLVVIGIILSSCTPAPATQESKATIEAPDTETPITKEPVIEILSIGDGGLISSQPCASPCFYGVHIGETKLSSVVPILESNGLTPCYPFNERIITCGKGIFSIIIGADSSTAIVNGITYYPSIPISVDEIIDKYGGPNSTIVEFDNTGTPEFPKLNVFVLWDSIKMTVELPEVPANEEKTYVVERTTMVKSIDFSEEIIFSNPPSSGVSQSWNGYGTYKP